MRLDKYLWCIRLYKTRSLATKAIKDGKVLVNDADVKPSVVLKEGDSFALRNPPVARTFKVLDFPKSRVGAKLVPLYMIETTSEDDLKLIEEINREKRRNLYFGIKGRPTKKVRREMIKVLGQRNYDGDIDE